MKNTLMEALRQVHLRIKTLSFSELLVQCRDAMGVKIYRAAEFCKMHPRRFKNLEAGFFRDLPEAQELKALSELYQLPFEVLEIKAMVHCEERREARKVKTQKQFEQDRVLKNNYRGSVAKDKDYIKRASEAQEPPPLQLKELPRLQRPIESSEGMQVEGRGSNAREGA